MSQFTVDGRLVTAGQFGNYLAGNVGYEKLSGPGYGLAVIVGIFYDFVDNIFDPSEFDWDADSQWDIRQGALRNVRDKYVVQEKCR